MGIDIPTQDQLALNRNSVIDGPRVVSVTNHLHRFIEPLLSGPIKLTITPLRLGSKHSILQVALSASHIPTTSSAVLAILTLGDLDAPPAPNPTGIPSIIIEPEQLPNIATDCVRWTAPQFYISNPTSVRYRTYTVSGGPNPLWSPRVGRNSRDMWCKVDEERNMRMEDLGVLVDLVCLLSLQCCLLAIR